jgi:hypothetical protein
LIILRGVQTRVVVSTEEECDRASLAGSDDSDNFVNCGQNSWSSMDDKTEGRPMAPQEPLDPKVVGFFNSFFSGSQENQNVDLEQNPAFQM